MTRFTDPRIRLSALVVALGLGLAPLAAAQTMMPPRTDSSQADSRQDQIQELQSQLQQATADNEKLQHDLADARREVARLQGIVSDLSAANASATANPNAVAPSGPTTPGGEAMNGLTPQQRAHVGQLGTMPSSAAPSAPAASAADAYSNAAQLLDQGNLAEAEVAFGDFLRAYPTAPSSADARYWYGFTLLARNNYTDAASTFVDYLRRYPSGNRAADAQVRLGMALAGLGNARQACAAFADVPQRYPRSPQAVRDRAVREARALHCTA